MAYPYTYNFNYYIGDAYHFVLYPKNEDGTSFNLDGYDVKLSIAEVRGDPSTEIVSLIPQKSSNPGRVYCFIDPSSGKNLINPIYYYDVELYKDGDKVYSFLTGQISTQNEVTISYQNVQIEETNVIIDGGIPTSIYYQIFDGGTP
jgi:hypothetical protein